MLLSTSATMASNNNNNTSPIHKDTTLTKIFVGGLPYHTTDESLRKYFEHYGPIEEAVVITDRNTGKSRGYGFVTMKRVEDATNAIRDPNPCIDGRKANVNLAILGAKPRNPPPGVAIQNLARIQALLPQLSLIPGLPSYYPQTPTLVPSTLIGLNSAGSAALASHSHAGSMTTSPTAPAAALFDYTHLLSAANNPAGLTAFHSPTGTLPTLNYLGLPTAGAEASSLLNANSASNAALLQYATVYNNALQQQLSNGSGASRREAPSLLEHHPGQAHILPPSHSMHQLHHHSNGATTGVLLEHPGAAPHLALH